MSKSAHRTIGIGDRLGKYRVVEKLGSGGAGFVYIAEEDGTGERAALKVMRPGADEVEEIHARFIREITVAQKLDDPHVVAYRDCDVDGGILYYAMEYVPWGAMDDVLKTRGALPWKEACECGIQIAKGLAHMHSIGIVHRDLKPGNVFLSDDGRLKLGDFGLARDIQMHSLTADGLTVGTAKYMAPQQVKGEPIDEKADLYALGCNLFEFITGSTPFLYHGADGVDMLEMMRRHIEEAPPKLADVAPQCPDALSRLVDRLLAKDPAARPGSAEAVAAELQQILNDSGEDGDTRVESGDESETLTERLRPTAPAAAEISAGRLIGVAAVVAVVIGIVAIMAANR